MLLLLHSDSRQHGVAAPSNKINLWPLQQAHNPRFTIRSLRSLRQVSGARTAHRKRGLAGVESQQAQDKAQEHIGASGRPAQQAEYVLAAAAQRFQATALAPQNREAKKLPQC